MENISSKITSYLLEGKRVTDDEFDENLYSPYEETIKENNRVLESYHKPKEQTKTNYIKSKILRLASKIVNNKN